MTNKKYRIHRLRMFLFIILTLTGVYYLYANILPYHFITSISPSNEAAPLIMAHLDDGEELMPKSAYILGQYKTENILGQEVPYTLTLTESGIFALRNEIRETYHKLADPVQMELYDLELDLTLYSDTKLPILYLNDEKELSYGGQWKKKRLNNEWIVTDEQRLQTIETIDVVDFNQSIKLSTIYPLSGTVQWFKEEELINEIPLTELIALPNDEGDYTAIIHLLWEDLSLGYSGEGELELHFHVDHSTEIEITQTEAVQGDLIKVIANKTTGETLTIEQKLATQVTFFPQGNKFVAYIPITYRDQHGDYPIVVKENNEVIFESTITVTDRDFHIQHLVIDETIASSTRNDAAYDEYNKYFPPSREVSTFEYKGTPFLLPVAGRLSTEYGETRHVNGSPTSYRHSGLDLANPTGTKIIATNDGLVTLSMYLTLTGNTIVIDHGNGIFSTHFHLHELNVEKGDILSAGETIGTVGTTGFSTGPHLHFTMSYYSQNIEPGILIFGESITYDNYKKIFNP